MKTINYQFKSRIISCRDGTINVDGLIDYFNVWGKGSVLESNAIVQGWAQRGAIKQIRIKPKNNVLIDFTYEGIRYRVYADDYTDKYRTYDHPNKPKYKTKIIKFKTKQITKGG